MNVLQPKRAFLENEKVKSELLTVVRSANFHLAMTYALAQFVTSHAPSSEQLLAVQLFISTLMHLPEADSEFKAFATKTLDHSIYDPVKPPQTSTK